MLALIDHLRYSLARGSHYFAFTYGRRKEAKGERRIDENEGDHRESE